MSRSSQTRFGRFAFSAVVAGALTFGGVQVLAGSSARVTRPVCNTQPYDVDCENYCRQQWPLNDGEHICGRQIPGGYECVCME